MMKKLSEVYDELDEALNKVMSEFWENYPLEFWEKYPRGAGVGASGSVRYGEWQVHRNSQMFDGLTFKAGKEQMKDLVDKGKCIVKHDDLITQNKYEDP